MQKLNLPSYPFDFKQEGQNKYIFDKIRKKYVVLTPEEWVRQNFIEYLIHEKNFPPGLLAVEKICKINRLQKRADLVAYNKKAEPKVIVECKSPVVKINQDVFDQIILYNSKLNVDYLIVTNGLEHFCCRISDDRKSYSFCSNIPMYNEL